MVAATFRQALVVDMLMAVLAHMWFRKIEPKSILWSLVAIAILSTPSTLLLIPYYGGSLWRAFCVSGVAFSMTLLESMTLYRISPFHPLAKYPGPLLCKVTKLWGAWAALDGKPFVHYKKLHDEYGPIVRIGPNELSIIDASKIPYILGASGMPKGPMWAGRRILPSKNFNANNSLSAVRDLRMLVARGEQFIEKLKQLCKTMEHDGEAINLAMWINYFTFDFMGDLAFGGVYSLLRDGDTEKIIPKMQRGIILPSVSQHIPWILGFLRALPFIGTDSRALGVFGIEQAKRRVALSNSIMRKDLFHYLLESAEAVNPSLVLRKAVSSSLLAIVAGSDTTASVMSNIFYYLLREPVYFQRLRAEIDQTIPLSDPNEAVDLNSLSTLPLLNAVINEALRLQPPIATGLQRAPALGSGGKALGPDMYIPEGTAVLVPPYVLHRNPRYFSPDPERFWPDRWISQDPNIVLDRTAFIPFSAGPANCPGKPLAIIELRYLTCLLARTFDMTFADDYDHSQWEKDLVDRFVLLKGKLPVKLNVRKT
ncbi:high nitrogen upregulated cytochrome P450 monooxygenase 2 [Flammula alnicola]|nr:high nitrogen upregulated cytochrome P450 monooxygenase 2 [Flammula alnicola]